MTKLSKKAFSLAIASFVAVTSVTPGNVAFANTDDVVESNATEVAATTTTYPVHFLPSGAWTEKKNAPNLYSYYVEDDAEKNENKLGTKVEPNGKWPGTTMDAETEHKGWYSIDVAASATATEPANNTTSVILVSGIWNDGTTVDLRSTEDGKEALTVSAETWFYVDEAGAVQKTTSAPATYGVVATPTPSAIAATATPAVNTGSSVVVSPADGTSFYETEDTDTLDVTLTLKDGVKSATYSIDGGVETTINKTTVVKVGEGKIANSAVELKVTADDGSTATYTYFKKTKLEDVKATSVHAAMVKIFDLVAASAETEYNVYFKLPTTWGTSAPNIYSYYVANDADKNANGLGSPIEPNKAWPGTEMTANTENEGWYQAKVTVSKDSETPDQAVVIFMNAIDATGTYETMLPDASNVPTKTTMPDYKPANRYPADGAKDADGKELKLTVTADTWFTMDESGKVVGTTTAPADFKTSTTATATPVVTATAAPTGTLDAYFGANLSAPQYNTADLILSARTVNVSSAAVYTFSVDGTEIYSGDQNTTKWNAKALATGTHTIAVTISADDKAVTLTKNYTLVALDQATTTPEVTPEVSEAPVVTSSAIVSPSAIPTVAPTLVPTTSTTPTTTPEVVVASGKVSFDKSTKTLGETVKISVKITSASAVAATPFKYTYSAVKSGTTKKIKSKTTSKSVNWTPSAKGTYKITVDILDANGTKIGTASKSIKITARVLSIKKFATNKKSGQKKGTKITISANATSKSGAAKYKIVVTNSAGKAVAKKASKKLVWKASKKGTYKITLTVSNKKATISKTMTYKIK